jgi:hypothetical protein
VTFSNNSDGLPTLPRLTYFTDDRLDIATADVLKYLCKENPSKSSGPDVISNHILKFCADSLYKPLTKLFNYSLRKGVHPSCWKISIFVRIIKIRVIRVKNPTMVPLLYYHVCPKYMRT